MNGWFGFWIFCAVFVVAEAYITTQGIDTALWKFRTQPELELQKAPDRKASKRAAQKEAP